MKTLRELLTDKCKSSKWYDPEKDKITDEWLEETLRELPVIHEEQEHEGRWGIFYNNVTKIKDGDKDRFFSYSSCWTTDGGDWDSAGYEFEGIDNVLEVYPKEVTTTVYTHG